MDHTNDIVMRGGFQPGLLSLKIKFISNYLADVCTCSSNFIFPASEISAKISLLEQVVNFEPIKHFMGETLPQTTFSAAPHLNEPVKDQISVLELLQ